MVECTENMEATEQLLRDHGFHFRAWDEASRKFVVTNFSRGNMFLFKIVR